MNSACLLRLGRICTVVLGLALLGGCSSLLPSAAPQATFYSLDGQQPNPGQTPKWPPTPASAPTLVVSPTRSASGLDSQRIIYLRQAHTFEYFTYSEWADLPARMLTPLIVSTLERKGAFHAVLTTPNSATGELRLDTELLRLQHDFTTQPSQVRVTLRAYLVDNATRQVMAWEEFDETEISTSEDAYGGVVAANIVVKRVMERLASWTRDHGATVSRTN